MSFGGPPNRVQSLKDAIVSATNLGILFVVSAGNAYDIACDYAPAQLKEVITVAAISQNDAKPMFSNYGSCTDIFAPGVGILSSISETVTATGYKDGTSMAAPHAAGVAALYLQMYPGLIPADLKATIINDSLSGLVENAGEGSPNNLLHTGATIDRQAIVPITDPNEIPNPPSTKRPTSSPAIRR